MGLILFSQNYRKPQATNQEGKYPGNIRTCLVGPQTHCYNGTIMKPKSSGTVDVPIVKETTDLGTGKDYEAAVIVFNCDCHTFQQVVALFCQFIPGMTTSKAFELAYQIHHQGSAIVFQGDIKTAEKIGGNLAEGGLRVEVRY